MTWKAPEQKNEGTPSSQNPILLRIDPTTFTGSLADVVFVVVSRDDAGGHLENARRPKAQPLSDFTLEQLINGDIFYADKGRVAESQIGLRMSNKRARASAGGVITLRVQSFPLEVAAVNNTGLAVASGGSAVIAPRNLTFTTNAPGQSINIRRVLCNIST